MSDPRPNTGAEAELAAFRERWREEVLARNRQSQDTTRRNVRFEPQAKVKSSQRGEASQAQKKQNHDHNEEIEPKSYHDLPDKEEQLKLSVDGQDHDRDLFKEPVSALDHYERAVEKEGQGQLGDSLAHYRKAFKLDDNVHEAYKKKHFPARIEKKPKTADTQPQPTAPAAPFSGTTQDLIKQFSGLRIEAPPPPTEASPAERTYLGELPDEILTVILQNVAMTDVASFSRLSLVCKRLAWLVMTEEPIWKSVVEDSKFGFSRMLYEYTCQADGKPLAKALSDDFDDEDDLLPQQLSEPLSTSQLVTTTYANSWRQMFRSRPRIRFNGCYISTVNYTRSGGTNTNTLSWGVPIHVVTYFRYLRFFPDGTAISLLTTAEPVDVVHHLIKDNLHNHHRDALPSSVMKDALRGRWRLSGPASEDKGSEEEGDVLVETEGVVPKYMYAMRLGFGHAGKGARNNKLVWKTFGSYNKLTDDWARFNQKNDKPYYWSRVKSFSVD